MQGNKPVEVKFSVAEDGHKLTTFTRGEWQTTLNRSVKNPELIQDILTKAGDLSQYERNMLHQWLLELY